MAPQVTSWDELLWAYEQVDQDTGDFRYTKFAAVEDDMMYYGQLNKRKADISFQDVTDALEQIPDEEIFPRWPQDLPLTKAPEELPPDVFIKRPNLELYDIFFESKVVHLIPYGLVEEAEAMEVLRSQPHPNIIGYHGCLVRRGYIAGLVLDRQLDDLNGYLKNGGAIHDRELFMETLESAIRHFHSLGWAHNDLNPHNVVLTKDIRPVLIDFGSARRIGDKLSTSRGTKEWIDGEMKDYTTSEVQHDTSALAKIRTWLYSPAFGN